MKKINNKLAKKASKLAKSRNMENKIITVKNAEEDTDTKAEILIQNQIDFEPKVSVIIPVYNVEEYLRQCLDSVVNQTLKEIEIICVDDGSTDSSLEILKEYANKDKRITVIKQENLHAGVARNAGLVVAKGEYVHFLDSDDWVDFCTYEELYNLIIEKNVKVIKFKSYTYDNKKKEIVSSYFTNMGAISVDLFDTKIGLKNHYKSLVNVSDAPWSGFYNNIFLRDHNIKFDNLLCANDTSFFFNIISKIDEIYLSSQRYVYYRVNNNNSLVGIRAYNFDCQLSQYSRIAKIFSDKPEKIQDHVKKHILQGIFFRYSGYMSNSNLDIHTKNKINKETKVFIKNIDKTLVSERYKFIYEDLTSHVPLISIIIPIYNASLYLRECLNSICNQTIRNIEIICINDASTDDSLSIINEFAQNDDRVIVIDLTSNTGAPGAVKNIGIKQAIGEYIGFVDSDDYVDLNYFEELYIQATKHNADIAASTSLCHVYNDKTIKKHIDCPNGILKAPEEKSLLMRLSGSNCNKIYKREVVTRNDILCCEVRNIAEDNLFSMCAMSVANKIITSDKSLYYYRHHETSLTSHKRTDKDFYIFQIYKDIDNYISNKFADNKNLKQKYLLAVDARKIQDFKWFAYECDKKHIELFKQQVKNNFPQIYNAVFNDNIIISLTSFPARINTTHLTIESLLNQSKKADKVILWLAPEQFPNKEKDLPQQLLDLCEQGLTIDWYHDIKSYKKLIPTLKKYPDAIIVTADDDNIYPKQWLEKLYKSYKKHPHDIHCHRVTKFYYSDAGFQTIAGGYEYHKGASYLNKLVGLGGVLYPPHCFYKDILNEELIKRLAPTNDDQWFWVQAALNGYRTRVVDLPDIDANYIPGTQESGLTNINDKGQKLFWKDFRNLISYYPKFRELLMKESKRSRRSNVKIKIPYRQELENWYKRAMKQDLDLDNPKTFNEKIQWLKLYDSTPIKTRLADKYLVRDWVKEKIGEEYLIPLLGVYDKFDDIDFEKLPDKFVMKCNHGSGYNIIVKDKFQLDLQDAKQKIDYWMNENFAFKVGCELHYRDIQPKIVIEQFLDEISESLYDYRFFCCNGKVEQIWLDVGSGTPEHKRKIYDRNWNELDIKVKWPRLETEVAKPNNLKKMIEMSEKMSKEFALVRVDFYDINDKIYFGEMTFTSMSGTGKFEPEIEGLRLGQKIKLPKLAYNIDTGEYYKLPKSSKFKKFAKKAKPYLLFPYYLLMLPFKKYKLANLQTKTNTFKRIKNFIYHKESKGIYTKTYLFGIRIGKKINLCELVDSRLALMKSQLSAKVENQVKLLQQTMTENKKQVDNSITNVINQIEKGQVLYYNPYSTRVTVERGFSDITSTTNFEQRFRKLVSNLPQESITTIVDIIKRLQTIKGTNCKLDLFNTKEKALLKEVRDFNKSILKISDNLYCYQNYFLPINHFEASVFFYKHGIDKLQDMSKFKDKAILDVGAFIGDSALILSPLTTNKVYSFEATIENYNHMLKTIELNNLKNVVPIKTAVGSQVGEIELRYEGSASSSSDLMIKNPKYIEKCPVTKIDDYVKEHNLQVGLIKVDIEGAEQDFLKGAMQTIKEQKPTMLISIYHNVGDFLDIKPMIESWNLGYKFSIFKPTIESVLGETLLICECIDDR